jgi:hypothetical protein
VYGLHTIMSEFSADCRESAKKLFSKVELINLARKSDYMGAVVTAPPAWVRPTETSVLDSPQYVEYVTTAHKKYETAEGAKQLAVTRDGTTVNAGMPSEGNTPVTLTHKRLGAGPSIQTAGLSPYGGPVPPYPLSPAMSRASHSPLPPRPQSVSPPPVHLRGLAPTGPHSGNMHGNMHMHGMQAPSAAQHGYMQQPYGAPPSLTIAPPVQYPSAYAYNQVPGSPMMSYGAPMYSPHQQQYSGQVSPPTQSMYMGAPPVSPHMPMQHTAYSDSRGYDRPYPDYDPRMQQRQMYTNVPPPQHQQSSWGQHPQHTQQPQQQAYHHQQYTAPPAPYPGSDPRMQRAGAPYGYDAAQYGADRRYPTGPNHSPAMPQHKTQQPQLSQHQHQQQQQHQQYEHTAVQRHAVDPLPLPNQGLQLQGERGAVSMPGSARVSHSSSGSGSGSAQLAAASLPGSARLSGDPTPRTQDQQDSYAATVSARYTAPASMEDRSFSRGADGDAYGRSVHSLEDRYAAGQMSARFAERTQEMGNVRTPPPSESRYVPSLQLTSGSLTARPTDKVRFSDEERHHSGSVSARYPSMEDRYAPSAGAVQARQPLSQASAQGLQVPRLDLNLRNGAGNGDRAAALGLQLDLQPRFAEDRYALSQNDPIVDFTAPPNSARLSSATPVQAAVSKGDLSARRNSGTGSGDLSARRGSGSNNELTLETSPRDLGYSAVGGPVSQPVKSHKSPVVPLIPLENISGFQQGSSSSSASSSDYGNPMQSDRSSIYMSTSRSEALLDTGRSVPGGAVNHGVGGLNTTAPPSSRSTATHAGLHGAYGHSAVSMPNTSRTTEFATSHNHDASDDLRGSYFGHGAGLAGLSLSSRQADDTMDTPGRTAPLTEQNLAEAQPTNRLGYMGLEDLRATRRGFPLPTIRSAAASSNGSQGRSGSELDLLLDRINGDPFSGQALNSARSSGRNSNTSMLSPDIQEYGASATVLSPRQLTPRLLTPRREPVLDSISECAGEAAAEEANIQQALKLAGSREASGLGVLSASSSDTATHGGRMNSLGSLGSGSTDAFVHKLADSQAGME